MIYYIYKVRSNKCFLGRIISNSSFTEAEQHSPQFYVHASPAVLFIWLFYMKTSAKHFCSKLLLQTQFSNCHNQTLYDRLPWRRLPVSCSSFREVSRTTVNTEQACTWMQAEMEIHTKEGPEVVECQKRWTHWCTVPLIPHQPWECTAEQARTWMGKSADQAFSPINTIILQPWLLLNILKQKKVCP